VRRQFFCASRWTSLSGWSICFVFLRGDILKTLAVLVCAALSAKQIQDFVALAQQDSWDVWIIATPSARTFIDEPLLVQQTRHPVTSTQPSEPLPSFAAAVVVPATFNTLRKWAEGTIDTYVLSLLYTWTQQPLFPIFVFPRASAELAQEPAFAPALSWLQQRGIHVFYQPDRYPPNNAIPWSEIMHILRSSLRGVL
jgi:phosphopantothenoylcysteine decarboxylase